MHRVCVCIVTARAHFWRSILLKISQRKSPDPIETLTFVIKINPLPPQKPFLRLLTRQLSRLFWYIRNPSSPPFLQINLTASASLYPRTQSSGSQSWQAPLTFVYRGINQALVTDASQGGRSWRQLLNEALARYHCSLHWALSSHVGQSGWEGEAPRKGFSLELLFVSKHWMVVPYLCQTVHHFQAEIRWKSLNFLSIWTIMQICNFAMLPLYTTTGDFKPVS